VTYKTLMVHLEPKHANTGLLRITGDLAERFGAAVIGVAACQPVQIIEGDVYVSGDLVQQEREEIDKEINAAEAEFRTALHDRASALEWRSAVTFASLPDYLADEARSVDLIVTRVDHPGSVFDGTRYVSVGDLVMQAGRPVLIVPAAANELRLERALVAWQDTREARRAVLDALPLLKRATHIAVVEVVAAAELPAARVRVRDVVAWLGRHGIVAEALASASTDDDGIRLGAVAADQGADIIVAGAYGHNRIREWAFGGVTRELLLHSDRCVLVSH
jgi:nucleotide-binding universal stress UspA family protein